MLRSKYLNCSWALICMLEKLLDFVSLPTDFTVQVLPREKWAMKHSCKIYQYFLLYTLPSSESTCSRRLLQPLRLRPEMTCTWPVFTTASSLGMRRFFSERTLSKWKTPRAGKAEFLDFSLDVFTWFLFLCCNLSHKLHHLTVPWINSKLMHKSVSECVGAKRSLVHNLLQCWQKVMRTIIFPPSCLLHMWCFLVACILYNSKQAAVVKTALILIFSV